MGTYEGLIENIRKLMEERGLKQCFVASKAGFTDAEFSNILNARRKLLRVEHIVPIAQALGVTPNDLFQTS